MNFRSAFSEVQPLSTYKNELWGVTLRKFVFLINFELTNQEIVISDVICWHSNPPRRLQTYSRRHFRCDYDWSYGAVIHGKPQITPNHKLRLLKYVWKLRNGSSLTARCQRVDPRHPVLCVYYGTGSSREMRVAALEDFKSNLLVEVDQRTEGRGLFESYPVQAIKMPANSTLSEHQKVISSYNGDSSDIVRFVFML